MDRRLAFALPPALLLLAAGSAAADTLRVPKDFPTIQSAIDAAQSGDVILIGKGTYTEAVSIVSRTGLVLKGQGNPLLDGLDVQVPLRIESSTDITVQGLLLTRGNPAAIEVVSCTRPTITKCRIEGGPDMGIYLESSAEAKVVGCRVSDVEDEGIRADFCSRLEIAKCRIARVGDEGITSNAMSEGLIHGNRIEDVASDGLSISEGDGTKATQSRILKNRIDRPGDDGIDLTGSNNEVSGNMVVDAGDEGVLLRGAESSTQNLVSKNRVIGPDERGFVVDGVAHTLEKNLVLKARDDSYRVSGSDHVLARNKSIATGNDGIKLVDANSCRIEKNVIAKSAEDGIDLDGVTNDNVLLGNKVAGSGRSGIDVGGIGNEVEGNRVTKAIQYGFDLESGGNTLRKNSASGSGIADLRDQAGAGANVYEDNKFKTIVMPN